MDDDELARAVDGIIAEEEQRTDALRESGKHLAQHLGCNVGLDYLGDPACDRLPVLGVVEWPDGTTSQVRAGFVERDEDVTS